MGEPVAAALAALAALVGAEHVAADAESRAQAVSSWYPVQVKERLARGAGLSDTGNVLAVVAPGTADEVAAVVGWANGTRTPLMPFGGGSNTVGSTWPDVPSVAVTLRRLQDVEVDDDALLVRAGAGCTLGALETLLNERGLTLGHAPQSRSLATVGGSVAADAIGAFSGRYGRQSDLTRALDVVLPTGEFVRVSGASAGPYFGAENGSLGIVTGAVMRVWPRPDVRAWAAFTFDNFAAGLDALRRVLRTDARPAAARLLDETSAAALPGRFGLAAGPLLLLAFEGDELPQTGQYQMAHAVCQKLGGMPGPPETGEAWLQAYDNDTGWMAPNGRPGGLADAVAASAPWPRAGDVYRATDAALRPLVARLDVEAAHPTPHDVALTFRFTADTAGPDEAVALHRRILEAAADAALGSGGALAHHYGVGRAYGGLIARDPNRAAQRALRARLAATLDPNRILNPRKAGE